tara:strand:- start:4015 stop:5289 length:1275 start_codon:yes stop_codon:yes gene_type:complete
MSVRTPAYLIPVFVLLAAPAAAQLSIQDLSTQTPTDLVNAIVGGGGVGVSNVTFAGDAVCAGTFTGGTGIVGFETGLILSTGNVNDAIGPNISGSTTGLCGGAGDADLDTLIPGFTTLDASVLEFDFECSSIQFITFNYVFASEEYNEYVNSAYNDAFGFFVNGVNAALLPDGVTAVTIDTVNNGLNPGFYIDNDCATPAVCGVDIEYDGLTVVLTVSAAVNPGVNHIKLAVGDAGDTAFDSAVFIQASSFVCAVSNDITIGCDPALNHIDGQSVDLSGSSFGSGIGSDLHLSASNGPTSFSSMGFFVASMDGSQNITVPNSGILCLGSPWGRYNALIAGNQSYPQLNSLGTFNQVTGEFENMSGTATSAGGLGFDIPIEAPFAPPGMLINSGETWFFQLWYRDMTVGGGMSSNFSNMVEATFP